MTGASPPANSARGLLWVFVVALVLRIAAIFALQSPRGVDRGPWEFGFEAACIAKSVHEGQGFAGPWTREMVPWNAGSGATGWLAPGYPALYAGLMSLAGGFTATAALLLFLVQSVVSALTCVFTSRLGAALGEERAGRMAGWMLAFLPASIWNAAAVVWDTTFVACGVVLVLWAAFALRRSGARQHALFGLGFGALLLVNPAPLVLVPVLSWIAWRERVSLRDCVLKTALFGACAFIVVWPWLARNQRQVGVFALRTNLGVELDVGNNDEANGRFQLTRHPSNGASAFERYRAIGEARYAQEATQRVRTWIAEHKGRFVELSLLRATFFWIGVNPMADARVDNSGQRAATDAKSWIKYVAFLGVGVLGLLGAIAWARRAFAGRVLVAVYALFPLVYYAVHALERYRFPIEPLLVLSAAWIVCELRARAASRALSSSP
jgi:4-amino-4-deoxy-L-arabinose transferase-like glycosyltransferase